MICGISVPPPGMEPCQKCAEVKNPPTNPEVQSLGWKDPLDRGMATDSSILVWRIPLTEEPGRLQSMWLQRVGRD